MTGLVLDDHADGSGGLHRLSTVAQCEDECRKKNNKRRMKRREKGGDFGSISPHLRLATNHEALDEHERCDIVKSYVLAVDAKNRGMGSFEEGAPVAEDGNWRKIPKEDALVTNANQHSRRSSVNKLEGAAADNMFVEMLLASTPRKKNKRKKKDHEGQPSNAPSEDDSVAWKPHPATGMSGKKDEKKKEDTGTRHNGSPNGETFDGSMSEDVRLAKMALVSEGATGSTVFSDLSAISSTLQNHGPCHIIQGKRFSKEEDEIIKDAVSRYIKRKRLGKEGLHMIFNCMKYPQVKRGFWKKIGASIPWRLYTAVRKRAEKLFLTDWGHKWTPEEIEFVQSYVRKNGKCWKFMADALGVFWQQVFYAWRRNRNSNFRLGPWSQDEYKQLFDLVHKDLQMNALLEKNDDKHGILRENISWQAISDTMGTRLEDHIRLKWYKTLSSSMVHQGLWSDTDDYRLVHSLVKLDACCLEDVDWDNLLANRPGDVCRKRWVQMTKHIGGTIDRPFMEQVELLSRRYCNDMLEYRAKALKKSS